MGLGSGDGIASLLGRFDENGAAYRRAVVTAMPSDRAFLFLQGMATRFFERLGHALAARGHAVHRVNFNGGDQAFWRLRGAVDFRGREHEWPEFSIA